MIGLFKTELIYNKGPWRGLNDVEFGSLEWVDWWNNRRLLAPIGMISPAEAEALYLQSGSAGHGARDSRDRVSMRPGAVHSIDIPFPPRQQRRDLDPFPS